MEAFALTKVKGNKKCLCTFPFSFLVYVFLHYGDEVLGQQSSTSIGALILGQQWCTLRVGLFVTTYGLMWYIEKGII